MVLITGGGTGIGLALAAAFHRAGARVAIVSRDADHLRQARARLAARAGVGGEDDRLLAVRADVRLRESIGAAAARVLEAWEGIDILINSAGVSGLTPIDARGADAERRWIDIIETNLKEPYLATRACLPYIPAGGRIINIASVLGKFGVAGYTAYCASKHAVVGFTRALAAELAPRRITVNAICPGWVDTAMAEAGVRQSAERLGLSPAAFRTAALERVPLGRFLDPKEVAPLALYLASLEAAAVSGAARRSTSRAARRPGRRRAVMNLAIGRPYTGTAAEQAPERAWRDAFVPLDGIRQAA